MRVCQVVSNTWDRSSKQLAGGKTKEEYLSQIGTEGDDAKETDLKVLCHLYQVRAELPSGAPHTSSQGKKIVQSVTGMDYKNIIVLKDSQITLIKLQTETNTVHKSEAEHTTVLLL